MGPSEFYIFVDLEYSMIEYSRMQIVNIMNILMILMM